VALGDDLWNVVFHDGSIGSSDAHVNRQGQFAHPLEFDVSAVGS